MIDRNMDPEERMLLKAARDSATLTDFVKAWCEGPCLAGLIDAARHSGVLYYGYLLPVSVLWVLSVKFNIPLGEDDDFNDPEFLVEIGVYDALDDLVCNWEIPNA